MKKLIVLLPAMLCVFALAGCGSTEWTMTDMAGQERPLSIQDAAAVDRYLKSGGWQDDLTDCIAVHLTDGRGRRVDYCADCGIFNDLSAGQRLTLGESGRKDINKRLDQYGSLWDMG